MNYLDLDNIPEGIGIRKEGETIILGCSRHPLSLTNYYTIAISIGLVSLIFLPIATPFTWFKLLIGTITGFMGMSTLIVELGDVEFWRKKRKPFSGQRQIGL